MRPELLVLADVPVLDYETLSVHLLRVSLQECREQYTLVIDNSNPALAAMLEQYAADEYVLHKRYVKTLTEAVSVADIILLFLSPDRKGIFNTCKLAAEQRRIKLCSVVHEDRYYG